MRHCKQYMKYQMLYMLLICLLWHSLLTSSTLSTSSLKRILEPPLTQYSLGKSLPGKKETQLENRSVRETEGHIVSHCRPILILISFPVTFSRRLLRLLVSLSEILCVRRFASGS